MTHSDIVAAKGAAEIAAALGLPAVNVRMWKKRNVIPRAAWAELIDAYPDVTLDALKNAELGKVRHATPSKIEAA